MTALASVLVLEDPETTSPSPPAATLLPDGVVRWERVRTVAALREALRRPGDWQLVISDFAVNGPAALEAIAVTHQAAPWIPVVVLARGRTQVTVADVIHEWFAHRASADALPPADQPTGRVFNTQLFDLARRLLEAQEAERRHIARELHDEFGQLLTAVRLNLEAAQRQRSAPTNDAMSEALALVSRAIQQVRNFSVELWPTVLDDLGLAAALRWLVDTQARAANLPMKLQLDEPLPHLSRSVEVTCFRVLQEALTNVIRHACARQVDVRVRSLPDQVELVVRDDGAGFDLNSVRQRAVNGGLPSFGLFGMQERTLMAGGQFQVRSAPGRGTTIEARFPLAAAEPQS